MATLLQVGFGSGGMAVLDLLCRDARLTHFTLIEPDAYEAHNAARHYFPPSMAGRPKIELAAEHVRRFRPDAELALFPVDLMDADRAAVIAEAFAACDLAVCAVDREPPKFFFNDLCLRFRKAWTLGEVLSGGIGGWLHLFAPGGACYGCASSALRRTVTVETAPPPDYSHPDGANAETRVPASMASVHAVASWQALATLNILDNPPPAEGWSRLLTFREVPGVFADAMATKPYVWPRVADCPFCGGGGPTPIGEDLDAALELAIDRLAGEADGGPAGDA